MTITIKEVEEMAMKGISTFTKEDNSPRGCTTISAYDVKIGDTIIIKNEFTMVIE